MTEISIPVAVTGPGSQPAEVDGADIDILQMPSGMSTYEAPSLPEPEEVEGLADGRRLLGEVLQRMSDYKVGNSGIRIGLDGLDDANRQLVDQVLGEGEVSIICTGKGSVSIQESVLAGVWRVRFLDQDEELVGDVIEIADIPTLIREDTFADAAAGVSNDSDAIPEGVLNAPPLVAEINDKVAEYRADSESHVINLTLLPQTEQDLAYLADRLGEGGVTILSRGYGNCRITSTATRNVWWVRYFNSQDRNILNSLEITDVPSVACAAQEDIVDSALRLREILEIYQ